LGPQVAQVFGAVQQMAVVTNVIPKVDQVADAIADLGSVTNLGLQVDQLTSAMGQIMALTNVAGQIAGLATDVTTLLDASTALSNGLAALTAAMGSVGDISTNLTALSSLQVTVTGMAEMSSNMFYSMEGKLGSATDPAGVDTVFGQLATIEQSMTGVGGTTKLALQKATSARTEAQNAATAISEVKKRIGAGQMSQALADLAVIRKSLGAAAEQAQGIPTAMSTEELVKSIRDAMGKIDEMAKARGLQPLGQPTELKEGSLTDPQTVAKLMNSIAETKAMMDAMRLLMDEAVNKPVVVDWMEGVK